MAQSKQQAAKKCKTYRAMRRAILSTGPFAAYATAYLNIALNHLKVDQHVGGARAAPGEASGKKSWLVVSQPIDKYLIQYHVASFLGLPVTCDGKRVSFSIRDPGLIALIRQFDYRWDDSQIDKATVLAALDYFGNYCQSTWTYSAPLNQWTSDIFSYHQAAMRAARSEMMRGAQAGSLVISRSEVVDLFEPLWSYVHGDTAVESLSRYSPWSTVLGAHRAALVVRASPGSWSERNLPKKAHASDAGIDICAIKIDKVIDEYTTRFDTGISVEMPPNYWGMLAPRSSLPAAGWMMPNSFGVIDNGYSGTLKITLTKIRPDAQMILPFKCAQLILIPQVYAVISYAQTGASSASPASPLKQTNTHQFNPVTPRLAAGHGSTNASAR